MTSDSKLVSVRSSAMVFDVIESGLVAVLCVDESALVDDLKFQRPVGKLPAAKAK